MEISFWTHSEPIQNSCISHSERIPNSSRTHSELIQNSFRTHSELTLNSFITQSELYGLSLNLFRAHSELIQNSFITHSELIQNPFGTHSELIQNSFGRGAVAALCGVREKALCENLVRLRIWCQVYNLMRPRSCLRFLLHKSLMRPYVVISDSQPSKQKP